MKLEFDEDRGRMMIRGYGEGYLEVADRRVTTSCLVTPTEVHHDLLPQTFSGLDAEHVQALIELEPDLVLFGTGPRQVFPPTAVLRPLIDGAIGYEIMDTRAACRSYNVLVSEDRWVVAALFIES
jgi:uncharacterized protein